MNIEYRKANQNDNLEKLAELIYIVDPYIYPYWFSNLQNCKNELTNLILDEGFIFNINTTYVAVNKNNEEIINEELNTLLNAKLLIPKNIIELVKRESAYINKGKEETTYTFEINDNNIKYEVLISINNEKITNIKAYNENFEYNMLVDFDKQG